MKLRRILNNRNWERVFIIYDKSGYVIDDPTERIESQDNVRKYVTMDGDLYEFIRVKHPWYKRLWFDLCSLKGS